MTFVGVLLDPRGESDGTSPCPTRQAPHITDALNGRGRGQDSIKFFYKLQEVQSAQVKIFKAISPIGLS